MTHPSFLFLLCIQKKHLFVSMVLFFSFSLFIFFIIYVYTVKLNAMHKSIFSVTVKTNGQIMRTIAVAKKKPLWQTSSSFLLFDPDAMLTVTVYNHPSDPTDASASIADQIVDNVVGTREFIYFCFLGSIIKYLYTCQSYIYIYHFFMDSFFFFFFYKHRHMSNSCM